MQTFQEAAAEWMRRNPGVHWGGTATLPPPEFIQAYETAKAINDLAERVAALEERLDKGGDA